MNTPLRGILSARWRWATIVALLSTFFLSQAAWAGTVPNLEVSISDNTATTTSGSEITYTVKVHNTSSSPITPAIDLTLSSDVTYISSTAGTLVGNVLSWSPTINGLATDRYYVTVSVNPNLANGITIDTVLKVTSGADQTTTTDQTKIAAPTLTVLTVLPLDFDVQKVGTSTQKTITLKNNGTAVLNITSLGSLSAPYSIDTAASTCNNANLAPNDACVVSIVFAPTANGQFDATLTVNSNNPSGNVTAAITGKGGTRSLSIDSSTATLAFGNQSVGTTSTAKTFIVVNDGTESVDVTGITFPTAFPRQTYTGPDTPCPSTTPFAIAAGTHCVIAVAFSPTAVQSYSSSVAISNNATSRPIGPTLTGAGVVLAPGVTLDRTSIDFGSVAYGVASSTQTVKVTNTGSGDLSITNITLPSNTDFTVTDDCPDKLSAGSFCTISVFFTPSAGGQRTGTITISTDASGSDPTIQLTGVGIAPKYSSSPASGALNISSVIGSSNTVNITVSNSGSATLTVSAPAESVAAPFSVAPVTSYTVAANSSKQIAVTCSPSDAGPHSQTLTYTTNDPTLPSVAYTITCTGTATATPGFASSPTVGGTIAFGDVAAGASATSLLSISEVGTAALEVGLKGGSLATAITGAQASSFTVNGTFPVTVADGAAATALTLTCNPQSEGDLSATLTLTTNDPALPEVSYTLTCKGLGKVTYTLYMPLLTRAASAADLSVSQFTITPTSLKAGDPVKVTAVVANTGGTATGGFWVDLYLNPTTVPTAANLPWNETCGQQNPCYGLAWYVESLAPGASVTLTSDAGSYFSQNSNWVGTLAAGTTSAYLYVDSWNRDDQGGVRVDTGAVNESNESNNRADITGLSVSASGLRLQTGDVKSIPSRPNHPAGF